MGRVGSGSQMKSSGKETKVVAVGSWIGVMPIVKTEGIGSDTKSICYRRDLDFSRLKRIHHD